MTNYMHARTGKGKIRYWRELIGQRDAGCRRCGASVISKKVFLDYMDYMAYKPYNPRKP